jgi:hypothetical protein
MAVSHFEKDVSYGLVDPRDSESFKKGLLSLLLANDDISEATLTYAKGRGFDENGNFLTNQASSGKVAVLRSSTGKKIVGRKTWFNGSPFVSQPLALMPGNCRSYTP